MPVGIGVLLIIALLLVLWSAVAVAGLLIHLIPALIVGLIAGWIAKQIIGGSRYGMVGTTLIGVAGSFIGTILFGLFSVHAVGLLYLVASVLGAVILLALLNAMNRRALTY